MPRKKVEAAVRLSGRITTNTSNKKDVNFVKEKLRKGMSQAAIIREAISSYRKKDEGKLIEAKELLNNLNQNKTQNIKENNIDDDKITKSAKEAFDEDIF